MERFFSPLKTDRIERKAYRTRNEARGDVFDISNGSITPSGVIRQLDTSVLLSRPQGRFCLTGVSIKPATAQHEQTTVSHHSPA